MLHEDYINLIIREELSRLINEDENPNAAQDQGFGGKVKGWIGRAKDWTVGKAKQIGQAEKERTSWIGGQVNKAKEKADDAVVDAGEKVNRSAENNMPSIPQYKQKEFIKELIVNKCMNADVAMMLHKVLFPDEGDMTYIQEASNEAAGGNGDAQSGQQQGASGDPSFVNGDTPEGMSPEMVQDMQASLSDDGSNPYANITVNLSE